jgi:hypothetical protein
MITIVSGVPRSGTSLMMQMLVAGGLTPLADGRRAPDGNNPRGYFEWEKAKSLPRELTLIGEAEGKVVKIISTLLLSLPNTFSYKVIFMERALAEVVASQAAMIQKLGTRGASISSDAMSQALQAHVRQVKASLRLRPEMAVCWMDHQQVLRAPYAAATGLQGFLAIRLDLRAMASQVDLSLYRQRQAPASPPPSSAVPVATPLRQSET